MALQVIKLEPVIMPFMQEMRRVPTFLTLTQTPPITLHFMNIMGIAGSYI